MKQINYIAIALVLILIGIILLLIFIGIISTPWLPIDYDKIDSVGSFLSGLLGPLWALAGIFLIFQALREQQSSNKISLNAYLLNSKELDSNITFLSKQINILEVQRFETSLKNLIDILILIESSTSTGSTIGGNRKEQFKIILQNITDKLFDKIIAESTLYIEDDINDLYTRSTLIISELSPEQILLERPIPIDLYSALRDLLHEEAQTYPIIEEYMMHLDRLMSFIINNSVDNSCKSESIRTLKSLLSKEQLQLIYYWDLVETDSIDDPGYDEYDNFSGYSCRYIEIIDINSENPLLKARDMGFLLSLNYFELPEYVFFKKILNKKHQRLLEDLDSLAKQSVRFNENNKCGVSLYEPEYANCNLENKILIFNLVVNQTFDKLEQILITNFLTSVILFHFNRCNSLNLINKDKTVKRRLPQLNTYSFEEIIIDSDKRILQYSFGGLSKDDSGAIHRVNEKIEYVKPSNKFTRITFQYHHDNSPYLEEEL